MSKALTVKSFCFKLADSHGSLELKVGLASGSVGCVLLGAYTGPPSIWRHACHSTRRQIS